MSELNASRSRTDNARNDVITGGIVLAAVVMFIGTGSQAVSNIVGMMTGGPAGADRMLSVALLLNVALILFGWRRYRDLSREMSERAEAEQRAQTLASRDALTGFYNRRGIADEGGALIERTTRRQRDVAMLMFDLDHFKNVNDVYGHVVGDALLKNVSAEIERLLPPSALASRLGGDEFACIFPFDHRDPSVVENVAEAIVKRLSEPFEADGVHVHISTSCGIARSDKDCTDVENLMRRADIAMYSAKREGRNRWTWFNTSMEYELRTRNELENAMRAGIPRGEFVPYFEQQIDLTTGRLQGFEMLARWNHPSHGLILPDDFIPMAEETGMIADLSMAVMRLAFIEARNWDPGLTLSVNISPSQLKDPWLSQKIVKLLTETNFPATRLEVEITESALFENLALAQSTVSSLKNQGIRLSLDDFGTGYSSLAHLRALPFDRIKIDKSFVMSIMDNSESAAIVNAIARLGDSLGLPVTAEGIETQKIEERLRQLGLNKGQGWSYGKPMTVENTRRLLAERNLLPTTRAVHGPVHLSDLGDGDVRKSA